MSIRYKVGHANLGGEERLYPRLVPGETVRGRAFEDEVAQRAARGRADVSAVLIAMREVLLEELRDEQSVQIPGVGTFTVSLKGRLDDTMQRLVTQNAKLKINLRPERVLAENVNQSINFEYVGE